MIATLLLVFSVSISHLDSLPASPPQWAQEAIWYQIFPERFRNGMPANDPTAQETALAWPYLLIPNWMPTPWGQDWYRQESWAKTSGKDFYTTVQMRRYGGDLQGIIEKLPYLDSLGITAIYLNPLNDAPSLHKYDARNYRHIDRHFGPDPIGDQLTMSQEIPDNPTTWQWTSADRLFLTLIQKAHALGMHVIMDYSWNHTGTSFWAWQDILKHQQASPYADWYEIESFDDPATPANEFRYSGWMGIADLPEWKKCKVIPGPYHGFPREGVLHPEVQALIFAVAQRWLDPDGDGDPSDGIDGFRLDVAEMVPLGFWRAYRRMVKSINPEAVLIGEIWWEQWPDRMMDPRPWLQPDIFDGVMHYRWYQAARSFLASAPPAISSAHRYYQIQDSLFAGIPPTQQRTLMQMVASHDTPRISTSLYNRDFRYKFRSTPRENPAYRIDKPDELTWRYQQLLLIHQFTFLSAPHIYYGDEVGMWGADDPDNRKPMVWEDLSYEVERSHPLGHPRAPDTVAVDTNRWNFYHKLIELRKSWKDYLVYGTLHWIETGSSEVIAYRRTDKEGNHLLILLNRSPEPQALSSMVKTGLHRDLLSGIVVDLSPSFVLPPLTGYILYPVNRTD